MTDDAQPDAEPRPMKLSLGPIHYFWERARIFDFYRAAATWPVDVVYLGEVVCSKRRELRRDDWLAIADDLSAAGKEVVLSTLTLIEAESELSYMRRLIDNGRYSIEANDMAAINMAAGRTPFVAGPHINTYNAGMLTLLSQLGGRRWVMPIELGGGALACLQAERPPGLETEVFAFGRMPLSFSARCFTARAHNVGKDQCAFRCINDPDGLRLATQEGQSLVVLNGIQTMSAGTYNLLDQIPAMRDLGVDVIRLSPQVRGMEKIVATFREALTASDAIPASALASCIGDNACNGYWYGRAGMDWLTPR